MENYRKNSHSLYDLKLHVVWITKYRKPVLTGQTGQVLAVGNGRLAKDGVTTLPLQVKAGDKVFFGKYAGTEAGSDLIVLREEDILGVIDQ